MLSEINRQVDELLMIAAIQTKKQGEKPGEFIKKWSKHFTRMKDFKSKHFQFR